MAIVSVQNLTLLLAFTCIAVTSVVCTYLSVASGDQALDDTKAASAQQLDSTRGSCSTALNSTRSAGDAAVGNCFSAAEAAISARTKELLLSTVAQAASVLRGTMRNLEAQVQQWQDYLDAQPESNLVDYDWLFAQRTRLYADRKAQTYLGVTSTAVWTYDGHMVLMYEGAATIHNPPGGLHIIQLSTSRAGQSGAWAGSVVDATGTYNTTLDPVHDGPGRLPNGQREPVSCRPGVPSPITGKECNYMAMWGCRTHRLVPSKGKHDNGVCILSEWDTRTNTLSTLTKALWPIGRPRWSQMLSLVGQRGILCASVFGKNGAKVGFFFVALEATAMSRVIAGIKIAGPEAKTRLLLVIDSNWLSRKVALPVFQQSGDTLAVSHGNTSRWAYRFRDDLGRDGFSQDPRKAVDSTDPLVRGMARHFDCCVTGGFRGSKGTVINFAMNSTLTGGGWTELVPGPLVGSFDGYAAPENMTQAYLNGRTDSPDAPPLSGYAADGEQFFTTTDTVLIGTNDTTEASADATWWLVMLIDREYVLGEVDRQQAQTKADVQETNERVAAGVKRADEAVRSDIARSNADVQDKLDEARLILIIIIIVVALLLIVLSVVFVKHIVAPIRELQIDMAAVAVMKLEEVDEQKAHSRLAEVSAMQASFLQMISNLREYRSYMPASVLVDNDGEDEEEDPAGSRGERPPSRCTEGSDPSTQKRESTRVSTCASQSQVESRAQQVRGRQLAAGLLRKKIALLALNVADFSSVSAKASAHLVISMLADYLAAVVDVVQKAKGVPDGFNADRFYASFGAVRPCALAKKVAVICGVDCKEQGQAALDQHAQGGAPAKLQAGCAAGDASVGNLGTHTMKRFCCVGHVSSLVHVVENHNHTMKSSVLAQGNMMEEAGPHVTSRLALPMTWKGKSHVCHQVTGKAAVSEDEWMYQMEEAAAHDPNTEFNRAVTLYMQGNYADALQIIRDDELKQSSAQHAIVIAAIERERMVHDCT